MATLSFTPAKGGPVSTMAIGGGYLEVDRNCLVVITESAEYKEDIDPDRARRALDDAPKKLEHASSGDAQFELLKKRKQRAEVRLRVASK